MRVHGDADPWKQLAHILSTGFPGYLAATRLLSGRALESASSTRPPAAIINTVAGSSSAGQFQSQGYLEKQRHGQSDGEST